MNRTSRIMIIMLALVSLVALGGCDRIAEKAAESAVEGVTGIDIEDDGDELPADFPDGVPVYDATITNQGKVSTGEGTMWSVTMTTGDAFDSVVAWYKDEFADSDWKQDALLESTTPSNSATFVVSQGETANGAVAINEPEGGGDVEITITLTTNP
jgi:hypothetical protein